MIKPHEEFLTVSPNKRTQIRIQLPEKYLDEVSAGMKGKIERVSQTDQKLEACLTKLHYLLSQSLEVETIRHLMQDNLRGELSR